MFAYLKRFFAGKKHVRDFMGASHKYPFTGWRSPDSSSAGELKGSLRTLRNRSRDLYNNNDFAKRYIDLVGINLVGEGGVRFQSRAERKGEPDKETANAIELAFESWCRGRHADVRGCLSWRELQKLVVTTVARDGESLVRLVYGKERKHGFALQVLEADYLDENLNQERSAEKNAIIMGVEVDSYGKPVAYHFKARKMGEPSTSAMVPHTVIPASEVIHVFVSQRPEQVRGVPWMHTSLRNLHMLWGYYEAEVTSARVCAAKLGLITSQYGEAADGLDISAEPGSFTKLPPGYDVKMWDPQHPQGNFGPFSKCLLQGVSSGLGVAYHSLSGDLQGVSFSSIRAGTLAERDVWRMLQSWFIESFCMPVFEKWLESALLVGALNIHTTNYDELSLARWVPRRWPWVDPLKDTQANILSIKNGLKTKTQVVAEQGQDIEDVWEELAQEDELSQGLGIFAEEISDGSRIQNMESRTKHPWGRGPRVAHD